MAPEMKFWIEGGDLMTIKLTKSLKIDKPVRTVLEKQPTTIGNMTMTEIRERAFHTYQVKNTNKEDHLQNQLTSDVSIVRDHDLHQGLFRLTALKFWINLTVEITESKSHSNKMDLKDETTQEKTTKDVL